MHEYRLTPSAKSDLIEIRIVFIEKGVNSIFQADFKHTPPETPLSVEKINSNRQPGFGNRKSRKPNQEYSRM